MKKISVMTLLCSLFMIMMFAEIAGAHVTVSPKETTQGTYEMFTVRVPSEKDSPTVKIEVKISSEVEISRFEPKPGWKYDLTKDPSGKITSVVWTSTGEGLSSTEFGDFKMQGKVGNNATQISWKAYQTYKDGTIVEWTGAPDAKTPASVTTVKSKTMNLQADSHAAIASASSTAAAMGASNSSTPLYLSVIALVLGILALIVSLVKKAK